MAMVATGAEAMIDVSIGLEPAVKEVAAASCGWIKSTANARSIWAFLSTLGGRLGGILQRESRLRAGLDLGYGPAVPKVLERTF